MKKRLNFVMPEPLVEAREHMLGDWGSDMARVGLGPSNHGQTGCNYLGEYRSVWVYVVCVIFFPIGLLALLADKKHDIVGVELFDADDGTRIEIEGNARRKVWRVVGRWVSDT